MRSAQRFEILWDSRFAAWANDIAILFSRVPSSTGNARQFRFLAKKKSFKPLAGFLLSVVLHVSAFALITQLDFNSGYVPPRNLDAPDPGPIFIDLQALKELHILRSLPIVKPAGPGGRPGTAEQPVRVILQASTAQHPKFTITLNALKPDNNRQAISQNMAPPDLKIKLEQKLPDILLPADPSVAKPKIALTPLKANSNRQANNQKMAAPDVKNEVDQKLPEFAAMAAPAAPKPRVDMNLHQPTASATSQDHPSEAAPTVASNAPQLELRIAPTVQQPQMPVSFFGSNGLHASRSGGSSARQSGGGGSANASGDPNGGGIVVMSVDPATYSQLASLAQGNRYATLAIAPSKEGFGSPGGSPNGTPAGGSGGPGKGGDGSSGVGPGHSGGGGGGAEGPVKATLSAIGGSGTTGGVDSHNLLGSVHAATVFPVTSPMKLRRAPLVVSTGPMGGGGLDVYGALPCAKVYTIFLPMPGKSWVLEYCAHGSAAEKPRQSNAGEIQVEAGLIPPAADQQFDFHRLAIPDKDADKLIVLRALIDKDGAINDVHVFQGVLPEMDAAAALAFTNWKFRPATRASVPISVDVLVGIPARVPEKPVDKSGGAAGN